MSKPPMKGNYCVAKWEMYFAAHTPVCVRSRYIIQVIRDGNADIVTSIPLEKETLAALREWGGKKKEKSKTMENVANATGRVRHGSPRPTRSFFPLLSFFFAPHPTRVLDNRSRSSFTFAQFALLSGYPRWTIYSTARFRKAVKD